MAISPVPTLCFTYSMELSSEAITLRTSTLTELTRQKELNDKKTHVAQTLHHTKI